MKKLVKMMKPMKMIKLVIMSLRIVSVSLGELKQVLGYKGTLVSLRLPRTLLIDKMKKLVKLMKQMKMIN